jgi:hypothetical protein
MQGVLELHIVTPLTQASNTVPALCPGYVCILPPFSATASLEGSAAPQ